MDDSENERLTEAELRTLFDRGVLVEPMFANVADWFAERDRFEEEPFMADGRRQPPTPVRDIFR